ncbi:MAG: class I SAM-dependent methyltransferase [bacterium]
MVKKAKKDQRNNELTANSADRHQLYELSVQCAESEIDFVNATFEQIRGRKAKSLREDFCGTAQVCCEWVSRRKSNVAIGVDLDHEVLQWGRDNNLTRLDKKQRARITLLERDVMTVETEPVDIISAMNFSYWLLKDRATLKRYFERVHQTLKSDGILFMDAFGGYESFKEVEEEREIEEDGLEFTYIWEHASFNPINHDLKCHIHFHFPDGSEMNEAFTYEWRLWTLPEIRDLLKEVGFKVTVYWQGWGEDGEEDGDFLPAETGDPDAGWICYITAEKVT